MYCFYKKTHSNEHNESVWDNEWEGQVVLRHISTACGGGGSCSPGLLPLCQWQ